MIVSLPGPPMIVALRVTVWTSIVSLPVEPKTYTRLAQAAGIVLKSCPLYWIITPGTTSRAPGSSVTVRWSFPVVPVTARVPPARVATTAGTVRASRSDTWRRVLRDSEGTAGLRRRE